MILDLAVWMGLIGLGWFTVYLAVERGLYLLWQSEIDDQWLYQTVETWRRNGRVSAPLPDQEWGWLGRVWNRAGNSPIALCKACYAEKGELKRYAGAFISTASLAPSLGLLGTFLALMHNSGKQADAAQVLGQGLGASITGVSIAIVATFCDWFIRPRLTRLREQNRIVLEVLTLLAMPPEDPPPQAAELPLNPSPPEPGTKVRIQLS